MGLFGGMAKKLDLGGGKGGFDWGNVLHGLGAMGMAGNSDDVMLQLARMRQARQRQQQQAVDKDNTPKVGESKGFAPLPGSLDLPQAPQFGDQFKFQGYGGPAPLWDTRFGGFR